MYKYVNDYDYNNYVISYTHTHFLSNYQESIVIDYYSQSLEWERFNIYVENGTQLTSFLKGAQAWCFMTWKYSSERLVRSVNVANRHGVPVVQRCPWSKRRETSALGALSLLQVFFIVQLSWSTVPGVSGSGSAVVEQACWAPSTWSKWVGATGVMKPCWYHSALARMIWIIDGSCTEWLW
jgi:hypothetical protein